MFKFYFLSLLLTASSVQAMDTPQLVAWDDREQATGLHVFAKGYDNHKNVWTGRETRLSDTSFYQDLLSDPEVVKSMGAGKPVSRDKTADYVNTWVDRFSQGMPTGRMIIEQDGNSVGSMQITHNSKKPGVGEVIRAFKSSAQGKGLGKSSLGFLVKEWAPALRKIALDQDNMAPASAAAKFKCFAGEPLKLIYTTARPSNPASWQCYKYFDFYPTQPTNIAYQISCEGWEESQNGPLEDYVIGKHFSPTSLVPLQADILYDMLDEKGIQRTLSFVPHYGSLRYHFEREVPASK